MRYDIVTKKIILLFLHSFYYTSFCYLAISFKSLRNIPVTQAKVDKLNSVATGFTGLTIFQKY